MTSSRDLHLTIYDKGLILVESNRVQSTKFSVPTTYKRTVEGPRGILTAIQYNPLTILVSLPLLKSASNKNA